MRRSFSPYSLLEYPAFYRFVQRVLVPGGTKLIGPYFAKYFGASTGLVVDVGCGPQARTPMRSGKLIGVDVNPDYVSDFPNRTKHEGVEVQAIVGDATNLPFESGSVDECRSVALLHHLTEAQVEACLREMGRILKPCGRIVIFDAVWPKNPFFRPIPWLMWKFDRGEWIRHEEELKRLCLQSVPGDWEFERVNYSYTGMEGLFMRYKPKAQPEG